MGSFTVMGLLYLIAFVQFSLFAYFSELGLLKNALLRGGYIIGSLGFQAGLNGCTLHINTLL